jgi:Swiss Army Knife RNA repair-like protein
VLLFLDIDGVLRRQDAPLYKLEPACLNAFENAMHWIPDAEIVISSSWREGFSFDELQTFFPEALRARIIGVTPLARDRDGHARHREVLAFLAASGLQHRPWIAIDDDREHYPPGCEVLLIDGSVGFDREAARRLVLIAGRLRGAFPP